MIGITSYGGFIPRVRLDRKAILQHVGWFNPALAAVARGERAVCGYDEDSITMAWAAAKDCLTGLDKNSLDGLYFATTTPPFAERLNASILVGALNLSGTVATIDSTSSQRAGTSALVAALQAVESGRLKNVLVAAADQRLTKAASLYEMCYGDGAAALAVGRQDIIAEFRGSCSVCVDFVDHYRGAGHKYETNWEERFGRDEGYLKIIPAAVAQAMGKLGITLDAVDRMVCPGMQKRDHASLARQMGFPAEKVVDNLFEVCGETGTAHPLVMLVAALEQARPGERILVVGYGQGCDVLYFVVTDNIVKLQARNGIKGSLANKATTDSYMRYLRWRGMLDMENLRLDVPSTHSLSALWRNRKGVLGLVGGRCEKCGTIQLPKTDVCVSPECHAYHSQVDHEFADEPATVLTFSCELGSPSNDPPNLAGQVVFTHGGAGWFEFRDCAVADIKVGMPVKMSFRKLNEDRVAGFTGYYWKAVPQVGGQGRGPTPAQEA